VPGVPAWYDAGINRGLGVPSSEAGLVDKRNELRAMGVDVTDVVATTTGPSPSTSRTPTGSSWSTAASLAM